ncbi:putative pantothenate kinase, type III [Skeletonema marinoi]|uniref:Pantothenate kinase, type III n=1 Tax=Skeletonema marinoi TaxID=267567 RepID=A0AAD8YJ15_9STRA|nr:putative pantothenate kinase, type III [Skeletonema marinoi]
MAEPSSSSKWPDAAPPEGQQTILTISCGNSHIHWATHDISSSPNNNNNANEFAPSLFWRTPHINDDDMKDGTSPAMILSRMLPESIHDYIFGAAADASNNVTEEMAQDQSQNVLYTNADQLAKLEKLCASIPSNFVVLDGDDFFNEEQGRYNGMGVDRLATLTGAVYFYGHPALVFDGGTATTGRCWWGIGPGIQSKLQSMSKDTDALPNISAAEVKERVKETENSGKPLPTFARIQKSNDGGCLSRRWIEHAYSNDDKKQPPMGTKYNEDRIVTCTGVRPNKHLIHYGISAILNMQVLARRNKAKFNKSACGKVFDVESDDGDNIFRGSVTEEIVVEEKTLYRITYDDGDDEDVTAESLFDMLELYKQHGEKKKKKKAPEAKPKNGKKKLEGKPKKKAEGKPKVNADSPKEPKSKEATKEAPKEIADSKPTEPKSKANKEAPKFPIKSASKKHANAGAENDKLPTAKKPKTKDDIKDMVQSDPNSFVNKRVAKDFDGECFFGKITKYDDTEPPPFWHVVYDDGDEEDFSSRDLIKSLKHYKKHGKDDKNASD